MSKQIWIRLRSVLERDVDASSVELSRESAEEMLAEIKRLTAEVERLRSVTVAQETLIRKSEADNEKLAKALETAGRLFAAARDALAEVNAENEKPAADLDGYMKAANDYMRENKKLRAALWYIHAVCNNAPFVVAKRIEASARAALSGEEINDGNG